jgi:hypothetical protein
VSEIVKSLLATLARMTDAEKAELRELLPPLEEEPTQDEIDEEWADELDRRKTRAEATGNWGRPVDEVLAELKSKYG